MATNPNIYLSTYALRLRHKGEAISFQNFVGTDDFYNIFTDYIKHVYEHGEITHSYKGDIDLHLSIDEFVLEESNRKVYGKVSSGIGNDTYKVRKRGSRAVTFESDLNDVTFRELFFYLHLPPGKLYGYLILQRKRNLGAKGSLGKSLNNYLHNLGYNRYSVEITNMLDERVYHTMMTQGKLKRIDFIKHKLPKTIEGAFDSNLEVESRGTTVTSIYGQDSLASYWKGLVNSLYTKEYKQRIIEINDNVPDLDEVKFELELNGKHKTFHVLERGRTQPDLEISSELVFEDGQPTLESLVTATTNLIDELLNLHHNA